MSLPAIPSILCTNQYYQLALQALYALSGQGPNPAGVGISVGGSAVSFANPLSVADHASGLSGGKVVAASTASGTGSWYALQFVTSGTLSAYTGNLIGTVTGVTFPAGFVLYGTTTAFTTGSGTAVVAYTS